MQQVGTVQFNPNIPEHRAAVAAFMKRRSWSDVSLRFYPPPFGSLDVYVKEELLKWYMKFEAQSHLKLRIDD